MASTNSVPASMYYRSLATCSMLQKQLEDETTARKAMEQCYQKIHKSLDMFKGHLINRIRFHMNRHHTEYLRKVRLQNNLRKKTQKKPRQTSPPLRRSDRLSQIEELTSELHEAKRMLTEQDKQLEELSAMLFSLENTKSA